MQHVVVNQKTGRLAQNPDKSSGGGFLFPNRNTARAAAKALGEKYAKLNWRFEPAALKYEKETVEVA